MNDPAAYYIAWLVYLLAGVVFYAVLWKLTASRRPRLPVYCLRAVMLAIMATPWYTGTEGMAMAPALMIVLMDAITVSGEAAVRAFIPLFLATLTALVVAIVSFFLHRRSRPDNP